MQPIMPAVMDVTDRFLSVPDPTKRISWVGVMSAQDSFSSWAVQCSQIPETHFSIGRLWKVGVDLPKEKIHYGLRLNFLSELLCFSTWCATPPQPKRPDPLSLRFKQKWPSVSVAPYPSTGASTGRQELICHRLFFQNPNTNPNSLLDVSSEYVKKALIRIIKSKVVSYILRTCNFVQAVIGDQHKVVKQALDYELGCCALSSRHVMST